VAQHNRIHGTLPEHVALGPCLEVYTGYTRDEEILRVSQSGGAVSTILLFCIEKGLIDGAVVTRWQKEKPLVAETYIARTREAVLAATGSKYNPVAAAESLRTLLATPGRFAFVGTSCQIQAMRKAELIYPELSDKIALYLGLHCLGVFTYHFHGQVLHKVGLGHEQVAYFRQRDKVWRGWPCDMRIVDKQGRVFDIDAKQSRLDPRSFFTAWRCQLCFDKANEFCDLSFGDCRIASMHALHARNGHDLLKGLSEFVVRTERARGIIGQLIGGDRMVLEPADSDAIARSIGVAGKKLGLNTFPSVARMFRLGIPAYGVRFAVAGKRHSRRSRLAALWDVIASAYWCYVYLLLQYGWFRRAVMRIPHAWIWSFTRRSGRRVEWVEHGADSRLRMVSENRWEGDGSGGFSE